MVSSQVLNVMVVVLLVSIVVHEATMILVNVSISTCAIDMVM